DVAVVAILGPSDDAVPAGSRLAGNAARPARPSRLHRANRTAAVVRDRVAVVARLGRLDRAVPADGRGHRPVLSRPRAAVAAEAGAPARPAGGRRGATAVELRPDVGAVAGDADEDRKGERRADECGRSRT